jgi:hypothetical protein
MNPYFKEGEGVSLVSRMYPELNGDTVVCSVVIGVTPTCKECNQKYTSRFNLPSYELTIRSTNSCDKCRGDWYWDESALRKKPEGKVGFKTMVSGLTDKLVQEV